LRINRNTERNSTKENLVSLILIAFGFSQWFFGILFVGFSQN
jgi:hypothetical protein